jgi:heme-degrading monooxygenase HmoA
MFVRLTFITVQPKDVEKIRRIYNDEIVPVVKAQKGNTGIRLLEPVTGENPEYVSLTEWETAADAEVYETSGTYRRLVDSLKDMYTSKPVLKTYNTVESKMALMP